MGSIQSIRNCGAFLYLDGEEEEGHEGGGAERDVRGSGPYGDEGGAGDEEGDAWVVGFSLLLLDHRERRGFAGRGLGFKLGCWGVHFPPCLPA